MLLMMVSEIFILRNLKNLPTLLQHFYLPYTFEINSFAQIVTTTFSDRTKSRQDNSMNCGIRKSKSPCQNDVIKNYCKSVILTSLSSTEIHNNKVLHYC